MKYCALCNLEQPHANFSKSGRKYGDGYASYCKKCAAAYYQARKQLKPQIRNYTDIDFKSCISCQQNLDISKFGKKIDNVDGLNDYCKSCWRRMVLKGL